MRVLCSAVPLEGHVRPLLPIARASRQVTTLASHLVRISTNECATGFVSFLAGPTFEDAFRLTEGDPRFARLSPTERGTATFTHFIAPAKLPDLERILAEWRPNLIVHECTDLAAPIAAAAAGVPAVTQGWGLVVSPGQITYDRAEIESLWRSRGLQVDISPARAVGDGSGRPGVRRSLASRLVGRWPRRWWVRSSRSAPP